MAHGIDRYKLTEKLELCQWTFNRPEVGILDKMVGKFHPHFSCHMSSTQKTQRLTSRIHTQIYNRAKQIQTITKLPSASISFR